MRPSTLYLASALSTLAAAPGATAQVIPTERTDPGTAPVVPGTTVPAHPTPAAPTRAPSDLRPGETPRAALHANEAWPTPQPPQSARGGGPRHRHRTHPRHPH